MKSEMYTFDPATLEVAPAADAAAALRLSFTLAAMRIGQAARCARLERIVEQLKKEDGLQQLTGDRPL